MQSSWLRDEHKRRNGVTAPNAEAFSSHRLRTTELVLNAEGTDDSSLCILGAGNCNDIDLKRLTTKFRRIYLVDLHDEAIVSGLGRQGVLPDSDRIQSAGDFDVTGIFDLLTQIGQELLPAAARSAEEVRKRLLLPAPRPWPDQSFDCVVSCCLLSQLIDSLILTFGPTHPELVTLILLLRSQHIQLMIDLLRPGGQGVLISDFVSSATLPQLANLQESQVPALLNQALAQRNFFTGLNPTAIREILIGSPVFTSRIDQVATSEFWRWSLGPKQFGVCGFTFRRRLS